MVVEKEAARPQIIVAAVEALRLRLAIQSPGQLGGIILDLTRINRGVY